MIEKLIIELTVALGNNTVALDKNSAAILQSSGAQPKEVKKDEPKAKSKKAKKAAKEPVEELEDDDIDIEDDEVEEKTTEADLRVLLISIDKKVAKALLKDNGYRKLSDIKKQSDKDEFLELLQEAQAEEEAAA